jgi:hypothetical protein
MKMDKIIVILASLVWFLNVPNVFAQSVTNIIIGTGKDGVLVVNGTMTMPGPFTSVVGTNLAGTNVLNVSSTNGFAPFDLILIIAMQDSNTNFSQNVTGTYEFQRISGITNNALIFYAPLSNSYRIYQPGVQIQVINVPEYTSVTVNGTLTAPAWNGTNGGILALLCQSNVFIGQNGLITMDGAGYRGGAGQQTGSGTTGFQGESVIGIGGLSNMFNSTGAGGGSGASGSAGGGGYGSTGGGGYVQNPVCNSSVGGQGGATLGFGTLSVLQLGGGGGGTWGAISCTCSDYRTGASGGNGGGIVLIAASSITGSGLISASGSPGGGAGGFTGGGAGGGAGGSIYLVGQVNSSNIRAIGGNGGGGGYYNNMCGDGFNNYGPLGGNGGVGRIRFDILPNSEPSSSPAAGFATNMILGQLFGQPDVGFQPPFAITQSQSQMSPVGSNVVFQATVFGALPLFYQWQLDGVNLAGQTNSTLVLNNVQSAQDGVYSLVFWNSLGTNTTAPVRLSVQYTNAYYYDHNDRLVGAEYGYGTSIAYVYDGNGNLLQQVYLDRSYESNALPVLWRFLNGLSPTNNSGTNALYGDADGNGWSNYQKWLAGLNPLNSNSVPNIYGLPGTNLVSMSWPFTPSNFVAGIGTLDSYGGPTIVVGADGNPGTSTNFLLLLSETFNGWSTQQVNIGSFGVTSIAVGQPANRPSPAIYVGLRQPGGTGEVAEITSTGGGWTINPIAYSTNNTAFVLGVRPINDVLVSLATTNAADGALYRLFFSTNGWNTGLFDTNTSHRGLGKTIVGNAFGPGSLRLLDMQGVQIGSGAATNTLGLLLGEPATTSTLTWKGNDLDSGFPRGNQSNTISIFYALVDDLNNYGFVGSGDNFVLAEYELSGTNVVATNVLREAITVAQPAQSYGLASVNYPNTTNEVFFTGEPDGQIYSWIATNSMGPLQRQLFSSQYAGTAWHALARVPTLEPGQGLAGLNVNPTNPNTCNVIFWPPQTSLWTPANVPEAASVVTVLPTTNVLGGLAVISITISNAVGDASLPYLQYQIAGTTNWQSAAILSVDGSPYGPSLRIAALPTGSSHTIYWNASSDLGSINTNVFVESRALDVTSMGSWSPPVSFQINTTVSSNPTNSPINFTGITLVPGGIVFNWQGGSNTWFYVQRSPALAGTNAMWVDVWTNTPSMLNVGSYTDFFGTNPMEFYRMKSGSP